MEIWRYGDTEIQKGFRTCNRLLAAAGGVRIRLAGNRVMDEAGNR